MFRGLLNFRRSRKNRENASISLERALRENFRNYDVVKKYYRFMKSNVLEMYYGVDYEGQYIDKLYIGEVTIDMPTKLI